MTLITVTLGFIFSIAFLFLIFGLICYLIDKDQNYEHAEWLQKKISKSKHIEEFYNHIKT